MTEQVEQVNKKKKPKWLRILEQQSWQAELLISGLAIYGSLQLPGLIFQFNDWLLAQLPHDMMGWIPYMFIWFLLIVVTGIIAFFIFHFLLRAVWIGIVGLNSVYPNGINYASDIYTENFKSKLKADYPDVDAYTKSIDDQCSTLFAQAFGFTSGMGGFTLLIIFCGFLGYLLSLVLPIKAQTIGYFFGGLLFFGWMSVGMLNSEKLRGKPWVEKINYPLTKVFGFLINPFFQKPVGYITLIFQTNTESQNKSAFKGMIAVFTIMFCAVPSLIKSNAVDFLEDDFQTELSDPNAIYARVYVDQRDPKVRILNPVIPSFHESGNMLEVFIPNIRRENLSYYYITPEWENEDDLTQNENRKKKRAYYLDGFHKYNKFHLNDQLLSNLSSYSYTHPNKSERGYLTLIPTSNCKEGDNLLKIEKAYYDEEGNPKEMHIRFVFDPKDN